MRKFIITMQYDETLLFPYFIKHYLTYFKPSEIFVIDHGSPDTQFRYEAIGCNVIRVPRHRPYSEAARLKLIKNLASGLLEYFDAGLYVDCDELINLDNFQSTDLAGNHVIYVAGFDVFYSQTPQGIELHGLLRPSECKPLIFSRVPDWGYGFHGCDQEPNTLRIPLAHIKYLFREESAKRMNNRTGIIMSETEKANGVGLYWSQGNSQYNEFFSLIDQVRENNIRIIDFSPIDPEPLFKARRPSLFMARRQRAYGYSKRTYHYQPVTGNAMLDYEYNLGSYFPSLLPK
jgi:hypothetical protein